MTRVMKIALKRKVCFGRSHERPLSPVIGDEKKRERLGVYGISALARWIREGRFS